MQTTPVIPLLFICLSFHLKCALFVRPFILRLHHTIRAMQCKMLSMLFFNSRFFLFDDFFFGKLFFRVISGSLQLRTNLNVSQHITDKCAKNIRDAKCYSFLFVRSLCCFVTFVRSVGCSCPTMK